MNFTTFRKSFQRFNNPIPAGARSVNHMMYTQKRQKFEASAVFLFMKYVLEFSLDFLDSVSLDNVADLDIVVTLDIKTAVHSVYDLLDIILESLE